MTSDEPTGPEEAGDAEASAEQPTGVFGNLPHTRPGARSPRRGEAPGRPARAAPTSGGAAGPAADSAPEPEAPRVGPEAEDPLTPPPDAEGEERDPGGGVEDIAWAGVAAAAEAATIGVRLATRALEAMRDAAGRR